MHTGKVQLFQVEGNQMAYQTFGEGPKVLLAFHGFGQDSQVFLSLEKTIGQQFTVFAIDLFFHGHSHYKRNQLLTQADWQGIINQFLQTHRISRFSLMGFSLGGRFAQVVVEAFADQIDQLILIAPDGITLNVWYRLATGSMLGRSLFRFIVRQLPLFNTFGHALTRLGLLNRTAMRFAEISLATPEQRELVYQSWTQFRLIHPNLNRIANLLSHNPIRVRFFTGAFDRIVPGSYILPLSKQLRHYELTILKTGHNHLIDLVADELKKS